MKSGKLSSVLSAVGYASKTWIRPTDLYYIILETDGNQFYNPLLQKIYFDTTNDLIKIKYSKLVPVSSRLGQFSYNDTNKTLYFTNYGRSVYAMRQTDEPAVGDKVYCYDPVAKTVVSSLISNVYTDSFNNTRIVLNDSTIINKIKNATYGLRFFVLNKNHLADFTFLDTDPAQYYIEQDTTSYDADIYLSCGRVEGFEFDQKWWGAL